MYRKIIYKNIIHREVAHVFSNIFYPVEFLILAILESEDSYGYEISQTIKLIANIKESNLISSFEKVRKKSLFNDLFTRISRSKTERYYSLTPEGRKQLNILKREWELYTATVQRYHREGAFAMTKLTI